MTHSRAARAATVRRAQLRSVVLARPFGARPWKRCAPHFAQEFPMVPIASPRHPFKALVALVAMAAFVHGVFAHVGPRHANAPRIDIVTLHGLCASATATCDCGDDDDDPDSILADWDDADDSKAASVPPPTPAYQPTP
jgi:hypothetical protein